MGKKYSIISDPEANILYQKCRDVDQGLWESLVRADPVEVEGRTGARYVGEYYSLPFLNRKLAVYPAQRLVLENGRSREEPEFQLCLTALLFLLNVDARQLPSRQVSPKDYKGGVVFFQGPACPAHGSPGRDAWGGGGSFFCGPAAAWVEKKWGRGMLRSLWKRIRICTSR